MDQSKGIFSIILLAAGASSRMLGVDKLREQIDGIPLLGRIHTACLASRADEVIVVLRPCDALRRSTLSPKAKVVENPESVQGMASSIRVGMTALDARCQAVVLVLADMPDVTAQDMNALMAAYAPDVGRSICRAKTANGVVGHPVLFGKAHFAELAALHGDVGARPVVAANAKAVVEVSTKGEGARVDLDTPADWATYRRRNIPGSNDN